MKIVLADIEQSDLIQAENYFRAEGADVISIVTDVSKANDGVAAGSTIWESTLADWQWVVGVNMWGVIHGLRVFVPAMLAQDTECHIVNTASVVGLLSNFTSSTIMLQNMPWSRCQNSSIIRCLNTKVKTSVLCPIKFRTNLLTSR